MAVFTAIGTALGAVATSAFATGLGATALGLGAAYAAGSMFGDDTGGDRSSIDTRMTGATGALTSDEAQANAKKRAYRSGVLFTSPSGLGTDASTSSAKLR